MMAAMGQNRHRLFCQLPECFCRAAKGRWAKGARGLNRCRDNRCAGRVVLEVDVAITTSGSSQAFRSSIIM
jgi:hypothetical protein